jgi:predicted helicase
VFTDGVVFDLGMMDLIKKGYLTPINMINQEIFSKFKPEHVFTAYHKHAAGLKAVVFCKDIDHSKAMAETFSAQGVPALPVYSGMAHGERQVAIEKFAKGEVQVLSNCGVLTEGFDEPSIQSIVLARKTASRSLFEQMLGRGVRLHENKTKLKVIQLVPVPPPQPVTAKQKLSYAWHIVKALFWLALVACLMGLLWKTCSTISQPARQTNEVITFMKVNTACKLRISPSMQADVVALINPKELLVKLAQTKTNGKMWARVTTGYKTGWCGCQLSNK